MTRTVLMAAHRGRDRALSFGALAETFDATRPSYPIDLVHWLTGGRTGHAIDVGCGTGRVASLLRAAGWSVIGVEPDERMAAIARARGIQVVVAPFEECVMPRGDYDLVCSGTAWHWVDPAAGYDVAAALLRRGGRLAVFRNSYAYDPAVAMTIDDLLRRHAPRLLHDCIPLGTASRSPVECHAQEMPGRSDLFTEPEQRAFPHDRWVSVSAWIEELTTHSPIAMLDPLTRLRLLGRLARAVTSAGGDRLRIRHETLCVVSRRR